MNIPFKVLHGGAKIPAIGLGTFGSDKYDSDTVASAVKYAIKNGWRLIDCASVYGNEAVVGEILEEAIISGVKREELFIVSKLWNDMHGKRNVLLSCAQSLKDLHVDYLDLFFVHWPFPNFHPKGASPDYHNTDAKPYIHEDYMEVWYQLEQLQKAGYVRHIGTSNMTIPKLKLLMRDCTVLPAANEMELHPSFQQEELFQFCVKHEIQPIGYSPIGSPSRPERDRTPEDVVDMENPIIVNIANKYGLHPAQVCLKWAFQRGQIPIPFSVKPEQIDSNMQAIMGEGFTGDEMDAIKTVEHGCRLIKGQVFLWDGAKDWTDLWDVNGEITKIISC